MYAKFAKIPSLTYREPEKHRAQDFFREVGEDLFYMTVNYKATTVVGTSHLGGKTSKFDTRNAHVRRHLKTCFVQQHQSECKYDSYF